MTETPDPRDLELFGLHAGASLADLQRAYQRARAMWSGDALPTYGLVDDVERHEMLERLTMAYERLGRCLGEVRTGQPPRVRDLPPAAGVPGGEVADGTGRPGEAVVTEADPGALLRLHREAAGLGLDTVARETRIRATILEALEEGRRKPLPAPVYVRGFVMAYAEMVGIERPEEFARRYLRWLETGED